MPADLDTALIERERAALFGQDRSRLPLVGRRRRRAGPAGERAGEAADPGRRRLMRSGQTSPIFAAARLRPCRERARLAVSVMRLHGDGYRIRIAGRCVCRAPTSTASARHHWATRSAPPCCARMAGIGRAARGRALWFDAVDLLAPPADTVEGGRLTAPMPGKVVGVLVKAGDTVRRVSRWHHGGDEDGAYHRGAVRCRSPWPSCFAVGGTGRRGAELVALAGLVAGLAASSRARLAPRRVWWRPGKIARPP